MRKIIILFLLAVPFLGCSNTVPEMGYLVDPSLLKVSDKTFAQADVAAATAVTATGYTGIIMVHAGTNGTETTTTDGSYVMSIRKISQ